MTIGSELDSLSFVALDVETANQQYSSICQIGLAFVERGKLINSLSFLVDPKTSFSNTYIHGIDKSTVEDKPTFKEISEVVFLLIQGKRVVHHTNFDFRALKDASRKASIELPEAYFYDSAKISRSMFPKYKKRGYGLKDLCIDFSVTQTQHHDAEDDARCLALTLLNMFEEAGSDFLVWENPLITKRILTFQSSPDKKLGGIETIILRSLSKTIA